MASTHIRLGEVEYPGWYTAPNRRTGVENYYTSHFQIYLWIIQQVNVPLYLQHINTFINNYNFLTIQLHQRDVEIMELLNQLV